MSVAAATPYQKGIPSAAPTEELFGVFLMVTSGITAISTDYTEMSLAVATPYTEMSAPSTPWTKISI